jgi:hypothetical protein
VSRETGHETAGHQGRGWVLVLYHPGVYWSTPLLIPLVLDARGSSRRELYPTFTLGVRTDPPGARVWGWGGCRVGPLLSFPRQAAKTADPPQPAPIAMQYAHTALSLVHTHGKHRGHALARSPPFLYTRSRPTQRPSPQPHPPTGRLMPSRSATPRAGCHAPPPAHTQTGREAQAHGRAS